MTSKNVFSLKSFLIILVLGFLIIGVCFQWASQYPYGWTDDDAYFYTQITYNIATQGISSFDGIHITDGYHLLWAGLLSCVSFIVSLFTLDKSIHLYFQLVLSMVLLLYIAYRFGRNWVEKIIFFGLAFMGKLLMETPLLVILYLELIDRHIRNEKRSLDIIDFLLIFLIPLARIDGSILVLSFSVYYVFKKKWKIFTQMNGILIAGMCANFLIFKMIAGHWFSVSSVIKASEATFGPGMLIENLLISGPGYTFRALMLIFLALISAILLFSNFRSEKNIKLLCVWVGIFGFSFGHLYLSWLRSWYYVPGHIIFVYLFFRAASEGNLIQATLKKLIHGSLIISVIVYLIYVSYMGFYYRQDAKQVRTFIHELNNYVPPGERIFQRDGSGYTGFFAERPIINGDGLVNTHEYAQRCIQNNLAGYLDEEKVCYVIHNRPVESDTIDQYYGLVLLKSDVETVFEKEGNGNYYFSNFVLFKRKTPDCQ